MPETGQEINKNPATPFTPPAELTAARRFSKLPEIAKEKADIAWMIYDLKPPANAGTHYELFRERIVYTRFEAALNQITKSRPGKMEDFISHLQEKVDEKLETPPINRTLENPFGK